jgi:cytochrome c peroxidase
MQVFVAQHAGREGGLLDADTPLAIGAANLSRGQAGVDGDNFQTPVFGSFERWKRGSGANDAQREFRASAARGYDLFFTRPFWIRDVMHVNTDLGNPAKRTCSTCHAMHMSGLDLQAGWMDIGTTNAPWAAESPELPLFKVTCDQNLPPHPFLGRTIYTHDPGRALISGRCNDVGAIVAQQLRGLAGRPPYFANGAAANLREVVDFYDRRFNIRFTEQEKQDLVNFLSVL